MINLRDPVTNGPTGAEGPLAFTNFNERRKTLAKHYQERRQWRMGKIRRIS